MGERTKATEKTEFTKPTESKTASAHAPLAGITVLDVTRMLPGAVLMRNLVDLGARVIKVENPQGGEILRHLPPLIDGLGAGFITFFRGVESVCLDLRKKAHATVFRRLAARADVLVESFRADTMARWGLDLASLRAENRTLVTCSLSGYGRHGDWQRIAGHDLNFCALAGLLDMLPGGGSAGGVGRTDGDRYGGADIPRIQPADICSALLALSAVLTALWMRERSGQGRHIEQPLAAGGLPLMTWAWADAAAGGGGILDNLLGGACPCYRLYACGDSKRVAVGAIEPKLWNELMDMLDLSHLHDRGQTVGAEGARVVAEVEKALARRPRDFWVRKAAARGLPLTPVHTVQQGVAARYYRENGLLEEVPTSEAGTVAVGAAPHLRALAVSPQRRAPALGEHTAAVLKEVEGN
jgi:crotonobetainyl-CoA:carnitine CoA-transferase CaiB-like acyl-CoA transferase